MGQGRKAGVAGPETLRQRRAGTAAEASGGGGSPPPPAALYRLELEPRGERGRGGGSKPGAVEQEGAPAEPAVT